MILCPVCEHQQEVGRECEVCGRLLASAVETSGEPVVRLEGLEATALSRATNAVAPDPIFEHLSVPVVGDVAVAPMEDLSDDRAPTIGDRTQLADGPVTCRFCLHVQLQGVLCDGCGIRLSRPAGERGVAAAARGARATSEAQRVRCFVCGAPVLAGHRCRECGNEVPAASGA